MKLISKIFYTSLIFLQFCVVFPTQASLGLLVGNGGMPLVGIWSVVIGAAGLSDVIVHPHRYSSRMSKVMKLVGIILLNDEGRHSLQFHAISHDIAHEAGMSEEERLAFNRSLGKINLVVEDIAYALADSIDSANGMGHDIDADQLQLMNDNLWKSYYGLFEEIECRAIEKMKRHLRKRTQEKI